jgi:light-regulated signal transduction histidine kinase (bacteriophytochrome)
VFEMAMRGYEEANARLRESNERLEAANRELDSFAYSVSHDLRAPLRAIDGFSNALLDEYGEKLDDQAHDYLQRVRAGAQRMSAVIDALLSLSRIARTPLRKEPVHLTELARGVVAELSMREPSRKVSVEIADDLYAFGDARLLTVVLENLLGNAWKFTAKRSDARITLARENDEDKPVFYVRDNGAGFDMTYANKLFAPFQRLHRVSEFEGTGIGLATVHRIISRHGGRIWAQSAVQEGATFFFSLGNSQG